MGLNTEIAAGFTEAQRHLAQATGMDDDKNTLYNGASYVGVWGQPRTVEVMRPGGGYSRRVEIPLSLTRDQFTTPPVAKREVTRIDLDPRESFTIEVVDTSDPYFYVLTCLRRGAAPA